MLTNFRISGSIFGSSLNINHLNLYIMEVVGGAILFIAYIIYLLIKVQRLKNKDTELKEKLLKRDIFVIESLVNLEKEGKLCIDGDADPLSIDGCVVAYHKKNGITEWTSTHKFYSPEKSTRGYQMREILLDFDVLNRNYLDFLIKHLNLIPTNWPLLVPFWGTVYRRISDGKCFVKCLSKREGIYVVENRWLDSYFDKSMPAIIK